MEQIIKVKSKWRFLRILPAVVYIGLCIKLLMEGYEAYPKAKINLIPFSSILLARYKLGIRTWGLANTYDFKSILETEFFHVLGLSIIMAFVLCLALPRRWQKLRNIAGIHTGAILILTILQYLVLGSDVYLDAILAGLLGAVTGYALYLSLWQLFTWKRPETLLKRKHWKRLLIGVAFAYSMIGAFALLNRYATFGAMRYALMRIPHNAELQLMAGKDLKSAQGFVIKQYDEQERAARCMELAELLQMGAYSEVDYGFVPDDLVVESKETNRILWVYPDGAWYYKRTGTFFGVTETSLLLDDSDAIAMAQEAIRPFLAEDESISVNLVHPVSMPLKNQKSFTSQENPPPGRTGITIIGFAIETTSHESIIWNNTVYVWVSADGIVRLEFSAVRSSDAFAVDTIPIKRALQSAKVFAEYEPWDLLFPDDQFHNAHDYIIKTIRPGYVRRGWYLLPAYEIAGTCTDETGVTQQWESIVDAVDRGIVSYIVPVGALLILLTGVGIAIWKKKRQDHDDKAVPVVQTDIADESAPEAGENEGSCE